MGASMQGPAGSFSPQEFYDFYYNAVQEQFYKGVKIKTVDGKTYAGRVLECGSERVRLWSISNKEEGIHYSNIIGFEIVDTITAQKAFDRFKAHGCSVIEKTEFPDGLAGYNAKVFTDILFDVADMIDNTDMKYEILVRAFRPSNSTSPQVFTHSKIHFIKSNGCINLDGVEYDLDDVQNITFNRIVATAGSSMDNATQMLSMEKSVSEAERGVTMNDKTWVDYIVEKFGNVRGDFISITMRNGAKVTGSNTTVTRLGDDAVITIEENTSYGSKTVCDTHDIRCREISSIGYTGSRFNKTKETAPAPELDAGSFFK